MSSSFNTLIEDLGQQLGMPLQPDETGDQSWQMEDGIVLSISDSGEEVLVVVADTGIERSSMDTAAFAALAELCLQINFATSLSNRFSIGLSAQGSFVMTCSDHVGRLDGRQLFSLVEAIWEKCRILRDTIATFNTTPPNRSAASMSELNEMMGKFV